VKCLVDVSARIAVTFPKKKGRKRDKEGGPASIIAREKGVCRGQVPALSMRDLLNRRELLL
jgi:hypothetical protein